MVAPGPHFEIGRGGLNWNCCLIWQHQRVELDTRVTRAVRFLNIANRSSSSWNYDFTVLLVVVFDDCQNGRSRRRGGPPITRIARREWDQIA
jgi:hypothetical protein